MEKLEEDKRRIERERLQLMEDKNQESHEWRQRYALMKEEHDEVISNLREANTCYLT